MSDKAIKVKQCRNEPCQAMLYWNTDVDPPTYYDVNSREKHKCQYWKNPKFGGGGGGQQQITAPQQQQTGFPMENLDSKLLKMIEVSERIAMLLTRIDNHLEEVSKYTKKYATDLAKEIEGPEPPKLRRFSTNADPAIVAASTEEDDEEDIFKE